MVRRGVELLRRDGQLPEEAYEQRERLLAGFRWILVDEYWDISLDQYVLIVALVGRTLKDEAGKLNSPHRRLLTDACALRDPVPRRMPLS